MTERERLLNENSCLLAALTAERSVNRGLREANTNLRVERDAADALLGAAMDEALMTRKA
jgi:hypothetical protein